MCPVHYTPLLGVRAMDDAFAAKLDLSGYERESSGHAKIVKQDTGHKVLVASMDDGAEYTLAKGQRNHSLEVFRYVNGIAKSYGYLNKDSASGEYRGQANGINDCYIFTPDQETGATSGAIEKWIVPDNTMSDELVSIVELQS